MDQTVPSDFNVFASVLGGLWWVLQNVALSVWSTAWAITHPLQWLDWSDSAAIMRVVYYGGSVEFFFAVFTAFLVLTGIGFWRTEILWRGVRVLEGLANGLGRLFAWAGLVMVLQQVMIVIVQRIFARPEITLGAGLPVSFDISWWSEELKLLNALVVTFCLAYTFVQKGHVRVDLIYSAVSFRTRRVIDMVGALIFMLPLAVTVWLYAWFFLWRHLIVPNPSASESLDRLLMKARALRWNVETIAFNPNGFTAYFLFKILLVLIAGLIFLQGVSTFWRSYLEWREGPDSADRYLDADVSDPAVDEPHVMNH